jgi:error-prone DNA polymerase
VAARLMVAEGVIERQDDGAAPIIHLLAKRISDRTDLLAALPERGAGTATWAARSPAPTRCNPPRHDPRSVPKRRVLQADPGAFLPDSRDFR